MDKLDRLPWFNKTMKSSMYLYGVSACVFKNLSYKEALEDKLKRSNRLFKHLNNLLNNSPLMAEPEEGEEYSDYQIVEMRLRAVEKAIDFNRYLLEELEECKG